jgi:hypothetical protein
MSTDRRLGCPFKAGPACRDCNGECWDDTLTDEQVIALAVAASREPDQEPEPEEVTE